MHAINILALVVALVCRGAFADEGNTNAHAAVVVPPEKSTRVWISSFQPITTTTDQREDVPRPGPPVIPESTVLQWQTNYSLFSEHLVSAAEKAHLDSGSLKKILSAIWDRESRDLAILPVMAISTRAKGEPVWEVVLHWEEKDLVGGGYMIHVRSFTFTQKTLKLVTWQTCG